MKIALDSNRYTDFCRGEARAAEVIRAADDIRVPLIVVAELRAGFVFGDKRTENEKVLVRFLSSRRVRVLAPDEQTTHFYADIYAALRRKRRPIPTNDLWIAAIVLQHDLVLFDRDRHFDAVPQVPRLK